MTKEEIYDEQIAPLMTKIIAVCKEHKISAFATFSIPIPADEGLTCTTYMTWPETEEEMGSQMIEKLRKVAYSGWDVVPTVFAMTITGGRQ